MKAATAPRHRPTELLRWVITPLFVTVDANGNLSTSAGSGTPVVDNLATASATSALSAKQGTVLAGLAGAAQNAAAAASATAIQAQTTANGALQRSGGTMTGAVNMGGHSVTNVAAPVNANDAANKAYVDDQVSAASSAIGALQSDVRDLRQRDDQLAEGIAIAMAVDAPTFLPGQTFAVRVGWGNFDGSSAVGLSAAGLIDRNTFGPGSSVILDAGIGTGATQSVSAGRAGVTFGW